MQHAIFNRDADCGAVRWRVMRDGWERVEGEVLRAEAERLLQEPATDD